jgi:hypothetical protein
VVEEPGDRPGLNRKGQSRAFPVPIWRLGVQCEGSVRDPIRLAALTVMNQVWMAIRLGDQRMGLLPPNYRRFSW